MFHSHKQILKKSKLDKKKNLNKINSQKTLVGGTGILSLYGSTKVIQQQIDDTYRIKIHQNTFHKFQGKDSEEIEDILKNIGINGDNVNNIKNLIMEQPKNCEFTHDKTRWTRSVIQTLNRNKDRYKKQNI